MKTDNSIRAIALLLLPVAMAHGQMGSSSSDLAGPDVESPNRFGLSYRMGFNMKVNFSGLGGFALPMRTTPSGDPFNYDDGYVYQDINRGLGGLTWYWGYDAAAAPYKQYTLGDPSVIFHRFSSTADATSSDNLDTPQSSFELTYNRELFRDKKWRAGVESAVSFGQVSINDSRPLSADVTVARDAYAVPIDAETGYGITTFADYPNSHYGNFVGNNALLGDTPTPLATQTVPGGATITGSRKFDASLYGFRFGPYGELPLSRWVSLNFSGGLSLAYVESDFSYNETVSITGVGSLSHDGSGSDSGWLVGGYLAGNCSVALGKNWSASAGAQFMDLGRYTQTVNGKQAALDLRQSIFVTLGISYSF